MTGGIIQSIDIISASSVDQGTMGETMLEPHEGFKNTIPF